MRGRWLGLVAVRLALHPGVRTAYVRTAYVGTADIGASYVGPMSLDVRLVLLFLLFGADVLVLSF